MATGKQMSEDELSEASFLDENFIRAYGLSAENALDYFACSPFYNKQSNNELVRTQNLDRSILSTMKGIEYQLSRIPAHEPFLFVIFEQKRSSKTIIKRQKVFYILHKVIYQAPALQRLIVSRLLKASTHLKNAFDIVNTAMRYSPSQGYTWHFEGKGYAAWRQSTEGLAYEARRQRRDEVLERRGEGAINLILGGLMEEFRVNDDEADNDEGNENSLVGSKEGHNNDQQQDQQSKRIKLN